VAASWPQSLAESIGRRQRAPVLGFAR